MASTPKAAKTRGPAVAVLRQVDPPGPSLRLGNNPDQVVRHGGGPRWAVLERPTRRDTLEFRGLAPFRYQLTVLFDGYPSTNIEPALRTLHRMGQPVDGPNSGTNPPLLQLDYGIGRNLRYVIDGDIEYDEDVVEHLPSGARCRQLVRIPLLHYAAATAVLTPVERAKARRKSKNKGKGNRAKKVYVVKTGDTLARIAQRELGDHRRFNEIAKLNKLSNPDRIKVGQRLRLP